MPNRKYSQVYIRYLKARLLNVVRPSFLGTGIFLVVIGFVSREFWFNPQFLTKVENQEVEKELATPTNSDTDTNEANNLQITEETLLSNEDKAIAADIDNMPNLLSDVAAANLIPLNTIIPNSNQSEKASVLGDIANQEKTLNTNKSESVIEFKTPMNREIEILQNPFLEQAQTLLKSNEYYVNNQVLGINSLTPSNGKEVINNNNLARDFNYQSVTNTNQAVINPLEAAMKISINSQLTRKSELDYNSGMGYVPSTTNLPPTYYSNFNGVQNYQNLGVKPISNLPSNPSLVQSTNQNDIQSTTQFRYGNSVRYRDNSSYGVNQTNPYQYQLPNSNVYGNPVQSP